MRQIRREASWSTEASGFDFAAAGGLAQQAGGKLSEVSRASHGTGSQVLAAAGEGLRDAGMGASLGASLGSVIPGIGTLLGGAIGAIGGAIAGVVHHLMNEPHHPAAHGLRTHQHAMLTRGLRIYRTSHRPGAFQDAILCVYNPAAYWRLRAQRRLPSEVEAELLKKQAYAAHAEAIDRRYGERLRRELAHLAPELRTLIGISAVTGHARELYFALHRALTARARRARPALHLVPSEIQDMSLSLARLTPPEPFAPQESTMDPFRELPPARDAREDANGETTEAGGVLDELALRLDQSRRAQRRYLRDSWVKDTWIGDFLHLDQPDDPPLPLTPVPAPTSGRPPTITLVPEPDTGAPPRNADEARAHVLANLPSLPPTSWEPLQTPVQMYFWDPFGGRWKRVGDGNGSDRAKPLLKPLVLLMMVSFDFPIAYALLHTSQGTEVLRAVKNAATVPSGDERGGTWHAIGAGASRMWTPQFTFYARTFLPGETVRFDFGGEVQPESDAGALGRTYTAQANETPQAIAKRYDALERERWATELKAANPERDWTARIYAGDVLTIPDAWPQPFWGAAKERGFLDASGPTSTLAADTADPFFDLGAPRARQSTFHGGRES